MRLSQNNPFWNLRTLRDLLGCYRRESCISMQKASLQVCMLHKSPRAKECHGRLVTHVSMDSIIEKWKKNKKWPRMYEYLWINYGH
jgi:hypothetical protein